MENESLLTEESEPPGTKAAPLAGSRLNKGRTSQKYTIPVPLKGDRDAARDQENHPAGDFRRRFFPRVSNRLWNDWKWQLANRLTDAASLARIIPLSDREKMALASPGIMPFALTPYFAGLLDEKGEDFPLRRTVIPLCDEYSGDREEKGDPLEEERHTPVPGIIHRYPDRVLFYATGLCATYCRYCTRSRLVGQKQGASRLMWEEAIDYIKTHKDIRDVLVSGGDPLTLPDDQLDLLLSRLRAIGHVEIIRIGTKAPVVLPQRITRSLLAILKRCHPLLMSIHVTHPDELTPEMKQACVRLADAGIPLGSQTVLLAGINDHPETMKLLFRELLRIRVKPYYLYQCDPIPGSAHFRTPVSRGLEIIRQLRGYTTGYAVPTFVIDAPGGGGKIPLLPDYVVGYEGSDLLLRNYEGEIYRYPDNGLRLKA